MARPEALDALSEIGVRVLEGQFVNGQTRIGEELSREPVCDIGYFRNLNDALYLAGSKVLHSFEHRLTFIQGSCTFNLLPKDAIKARLDAIIRNQAGCEAVGLATHEQYTYPYYDNYLSDHMERIELGIRLMTENGFQPVFFAQGFLGNPGWGK